MKMQMQTLFKYVILHYYFCIAIICDLASAKIYKRCDLARELNHNHSVPIEQLAHWICILFWESGFDTKAHHIAKFDGSNSYGIFQINDLLWCDSNGRKNNTNLCDSECDKFGDSDISDDVKCALLIHKLQGFNAWDTYNTKCRGDTSSYIDGCGLQSNQTLTKLKQTIRSGADSKHRSFVRQLLYVWKSKMALPENIFSGIKKRSIDSEKSYLEVNEEGRRLESGGLDILEFYKSYLILFGYVMVVKGYLIEVILKLLQA